MYFCVHTWLQLQLESFQQQANAAASADSAETVPVSSSLTEVNTAPSDGGGGEQAPATGILASDNQQVYVYPMSSVYVCPMCSVISSM